jgi:hypothetical protein
VVSVSTFPLVFGPTNSSFLYSPAGWSLSISVLDFILKSK